PRPCRRARPSSCRCPRPSRRRRSKRIWWHAPRVSPCATQSAESFACSFVSLSALPFCNDLGKIGNARKLPEQSAQQPQPPPADFAVFSHHHDFVEERV